MQFTNHTLQPRENALWGITKGESACPLTLSTFLEGYHLEMQGRWRVEYRLETLEAKPRGRDGKKPNLMEADGMALLSPQTNFPVLAPQQSTQGSNEIVGITALSCTLRLARPPTPSSNPSRHLPGGDVKPRTHKTRWAWMSRATPRIQLTTHNVHHEGQAQMSVTTK